MASYQDLEDKIYRLQKKLCCNRPHTVDELPEGNAYGGFVIFEDELYYWDGDEWIVVGGGGSGLEALDEGNGIGWRLAGRNPANYGNIGLNAIDLGYATFASSTIGATGLQSKNFGYNSIASGNFSVNWGISSYATGSNSTAFGDQTTVSGENAIAWGRRSTASGTNATAHGYYALASATLSTAWGRQTTASYSYATAWGYGSTASNESATAWGRSTIASNRNSTAWGSTTTASGRGATTWGLRNTASSWYSTTFGIYATTPVGQSGVFPPVATDELVKIGNGTGIGARSDAFLILKDGTITAPSLDNTKITTAGNKALITKEYLDANAGSSSGLEAIDEGNGFGWRLIGRDATRYGNIGLNATDLSFSSAASSTRGATGQMSIALGFNNTSDGYSSTTWGYANSAPGVFSTAFGSGNTASGSRSVVWGDSNVSSSNRSTSWGVSNTSLAYHSTSWGQSNTAASLNSTVFGQYSINPIGQSTYSIVSTDDLLTIGNGTNGGSRSNALKILKNAVQIQGGITAADASALTPEPGMSAYVTTTDATFTSIGFWDYENSLWVKR